MPYRHHPEHNEGVAFPLPPTEETLARLRTLKNGALQAFSHIHMSQESLVQPADPKGHGITEQT